MIAPQDVRRVTPSRSATGCVGCDHLPSCSLPREASLRVGMDKKALRRSIFSLFFNRVICPTGKDCEFLSSPYAKNKSLHETPKSNL
jgi:hypothetical protein